MLPETITSDDLFLLPRAERSERSAALGLPHVDAFLESVERLQAAAPDGTARNYLRELLRDRAFTIVSPRSGHALRSGSSLLLVDKGVLFSFPDEPDLLIAIGDLSLGYPICAMLLPEQALLLPVIRSVWGFSDRQLPWARDAIRDSGWTPGPATKPPTLVLGDTNFAHYAWNQLSALHELADEDLIGDASVIATQQPLGPALDLLPDLPRWPARTLQDIDLQAQNAPGRVFTPVGGQHINAALAARIRQYAIDNLTERGRAVDAALAAAAGPVLWLSVRTRNRTAANQHEMLAALGERFFAAEPRGIVVIDGFSVSQDQASYAEYIRAQCDEVLAHDQAAASALKKAFDRMAPGRTQVAVGLTICDSIALSRHVSVYLCHHGTVQHKVGWFSPVKGVVHCNRSVLIQAPAAWVAAQSAVAIAPVYLRPDVVRDTAGEAGTDAEFAQLLRHENYVVDDIEAVVDTVFKVAGFTPARRPARRNWLMNLKPKLRLGGAETQPAAASPHPAKAPLRSPMRHLLDAPESLVATGALYTDFFRFIDQNLRPRSYFEIGTHLGRSVKQFSCDAVCVDPQFMLDQDVLSGRGQTHFYQMPSDHFFEAHDLRAIFPNGPDVCFLDGMHRSEYLLRDFMNTEKSCHPRSVIFMHDCMPVNARMALRTHELGDEAEGHWQHAWTGDVWKVVPLLKSCRPDLQIVCLDCAPTGLVAVTNLDPASTVIRDGYAQLKARLREMDLESHTFRRLWSELPVLSSHSLMANPEDLTLYLDIF